MNNKLLQSTKLKKRLLFVIISLLVLTLNMLIPDPGYTSGKKTVSAQVITESQAN